MRLPSVTMLLLVLFPFLSSHILPAVAEDAKAPHPGAMADNVINLVGKPMSKVFETLGPPQNVSVGDPGQVWLDYDDKYSLLIVNGNATIACAFWPGYQQAVKGLSLSDSEDQMIQKLGKPEILRKSADGVVEMTWSFKDQKIDLVARFRNNKCSRFFMPAWGGGDKKK